MRKFLTLVFLIASLTLSAQQAYKALPAFNEADCEAKTLNIKVKEQYRNLCGNTGINHAGLNQYISSIGGTQLYKLFPNAKQPDFKMMQQAEQPADITLIYRITYTAQLPMQKIINVLKSYGLFEYVEPNFIMQKMYTPNDPSAATQWYINALKANQAWDITQGDTNMVIGITDSGLDTNHLDLRPNVKFNYADPINGVDDDGDGYVDNYWGWNMWANTGNVYDAEDSHGTYVAGISSAKVDNSIGIAGLGFKCKMRPIRIDDMFGNYIRAYEAVVYAADHGCKVINCSWGSRYFSNFGWDVIQYAAINKDAVVVASAGNDNNEVPFYPASYQYVLNVGGLQQSNQKGNSSSWGGQLDLVAYGSGVYSTYNPNTYTTSGGTSAAAPMVSAAAALLRSYFPTWSGLKIAQQIKESCDASIYQIPANGAYFQKFGKGKLDMYKMLIDTSYSSVTMLDKKVSDNNDNNFYTGDTLRLWGLVKNYLRPASNVTVTVSSTSPYVNILNNTFTVGNLNQNDTLGNASQPFTAIILTSPANSRVEFKFTITAGTYSSIEWLADTINRNFVNIDVGNVNMTMPSTGAIGFAANLGKSGYGFQFQDSGPLFFTSGFLLGQSGTPKVMDNVYGATFPNYDADWASVLTARQRPFAYTANKDVYGRFDDAPAGVNRINVKVDQRGFGWAGLDENFVILEYCVKPNTGAINNLSTGIFADWDILQAGQNMVSTDTTRKMIYAYSTEPQSIYAGVVLLTKQAANYYAFNSDGTSGSVNFYDGFTAAEKYNTMSGALQRQATPVAGDVAAMLGVGPFNIIANDSMKIGVAFVAGKDLAAIQQAADSAYARYWRYIWVGAISNEWNKAANWNWMRIPNDTTDVIIPTNPMRLPDVGSYDAFCRDISIYSPSTVSQSGANSRLNVKGNLYTSGTGGMNVTGNEGLLEFNGTSPQTIHGTNTTYSVKINNPAGVTNATGAVLNVHGLLSISLGDLINKGTLNKQ